VQIFVGEYYSIELKYYTGNLIFQGNKNLYEIAQ